MRGLRGLLATRLPPPDGVCAAATRRRRALSRVQRVTSTTASRICPFCFFDDFAYARAYLVVTSARDRIDNPLPMPAQRQRVFENRQVRASRLVMVVIMARWTMASWWSGLVS